MSSEAKAVPEPRSCDCPGDMSELCEEYADDFEEDDSFAEVCSKFLLQFLSTDKSAGLYSSLLDWS